MLDAFMVFTRGGLVLWSHSMVNSFKENPIHKLIKDVLLEERAGENVLNVDTLRVKWRWFSNLVFVVVYEGFHLSALIDGLLDQVKVEFVKHVLSVRSVTAAHSQIVFTAHHRCTGKHLAQNDFTPTFTKVFRGVCTGQRAAKTPKAKNRTNGTQREETEECEGEANGDEDKADGGTVAVSREETHNTGGMSPAERAAEIVASRRGRQRQEASKGQKVGANEKKQMQTKKGTHWDTQKVTSQSMAALDFSAKGGASDKEGERDVYGADDDVQDEDDSDEVSSEEDDEAEQSEAKPLSGILGRLTATVQSVTGNKVMQGEDIDPVLHSLRMVMMERNVAAEVATNITGSVRTVLLDKKSERFTSVRSMVLTALRTAISKVLTPDRVIDVLVEAGKSKSQSKVYSIVFLGVNGVGKSTSLAKVAYYLKHRGDLNVMIAACDTFRAGAVEQLRTHARNLGVHLYERGYGKDASAVAREALEHARTQSYDVVLIDTAGRMQDNEPLMRSLAKLVEVNAPDLVLFVGEGLAGNDALDQLTKFNKALIDFGSLTGKPRGIDGVVLTKFDTVDEKVGAALSMVYATGRPIVFVGTGQKYSNLKRLHVNTIVTALTS